MRQTKKALHWINNLLRKRHIKSIIFGGFAAKIYGSARELADIDIAIRGRDLIKINNEVGKYCVRDLKRYKDKNWDAMVTTINYLGQEIDIISVEDTKIFDKSAKKWLPFKPYFNYSSKINFMGENLLVVRKSELIKYKNKLLRRVDKKDVEYLLN